MNETNNSNGWLGFATSAFGSATNTVTNLVLSGQSNRTNRALALGNLQYNTDLKKSQQQTITVTVMVIGLIVAVILFKVLKTKK